MTAPIEDRITIVLADDHSLVREALRSLLETEREFVVVGEASDGLSAVMLVERLKPNILVVDLMMPGLDGMDVTRRLARRCPETQVVILSMHLNEAHVLEALTSGARGFVHKQGSAADLIRAIHEVAGGQLYSSPPLSDIENYRLKVAEAAADPYDSLTYRERQVLHLTAEGLSHAQVAERLGISPRTAETHRAHIARKLGLRKQVEIVRYAIRRGIVSLEEPGQTHRPQS